jgi:hypothetical protein
LTRICTEMLGPGEAWASFESLGDLAPCPSESLLLRPDHPFLGYGHWKAFVTLRGDRPVARVVAAADPRQKDGGFQVGTIGFVAHDGDGQALRVALDAAEEWLALQGSRLVRCPVQFSTWFGHRLMLDEATHPGPFSMEPPSDPFLASALGRRGYQAAHRATSHLVPNCRALAGAERGLQRMREDPYRERALDIRRLDHELEMIHAVAVSAFQRSWGFSAISLAEFTSLYGPVARSADPSLVRVVEGPDGELVGFAFGFEGPTVDRGVVDITLDLPMRTFVLKSIAVLPETSSKHPGLGSALAGLIHGAGEERGYRAGIHALMAEKSYAQRTSARWGTRIRSYTTYERPVGGSG